MDEQAIFIYHLCDELLNNLGVKDDLQCKMSSAEVMTFTILSALHFQCNYRKTKMLVKALGYFPRILSYSRLVRRIHTVSPSIWLIIFHMCKEVLGLKKGAEYIVDSFPVPVCQNNKIFRCRLLKRKGISWILRFKPIGPLNLAERLAR